MTGRIITAFILFCLSLASTVEAGYMGLSPDAGKALIFFVLFCGAVYFIVGLILVLCKWLKTKIKKWVGGWKD